MAERILLVENDAQLARLIAWILEDEGFAVDTANSPAEVPEAVLAAAQVIVFDGDGVSADSRDGLRALKERSGLQAIEIGYHVHDPGRDQVAESGLRKPFSADDLVAGIRRLLDGSRT